MFLLVVVDDDDEPFNFVRFGRMDSAATDSPDNASVLYFHIISHVCSFSSHVNERSITHSSR